MGASVGAAVLGLVVAGMLGCASALDKARGAHERGALDEAETLYVKATDDPDTALLARRGLADLYVGRAQRIEADDPGGAEAHYREALAVIPIHDAALTGLVRLLRRGDRVAGAAAVLREASETGACGTCKRLTLVLELQRGEEAFAAGDFATAIGYFEAAQAQRHSPSVAVAIADAHLGAGALEPAEAALVAAAPGLLQADESAILRFITVRRALLDAALAATDFEAADRIAQTGRPKEPATERTERSLRVARKVDDSGAHDNALARYDALIVLDEEAALGEGQRVRVLRRMAEIHAERGTQQLNAGDGAQARAHFERALVAQPDDWPLKLQRILAMSGEIGAGPALQGLQRVPASAPGLAHTRAILHALHVIERLEAGDNEPAQLEEAGASLARATRAHPDLPEVHLAAAYLLSVTETDELSKKELRALQSKLSIVRYGGNVYRWAEALAEVDRVRAEVAERKPDYPFTAPWLEVRAQALRTSVAARYGHNVRFQPEPEPVVQLTNRSGGFVEIMVTGPDGFSDQLGIPPGDTRELVLPEAGLLRLRIGRIRRVFYAESYTKVVLSVP